MAATPTVTTARDPGAAAQPAAGATAAAPGQSASPSPQPAATIAQAAAGAAARLREDLIHPDPLLDCLVEVCRLHGVGASRASLSAGLPLVAGRLTLELAERAAARAGMSARLQRLPLRRDRRDRAAGDADPDGQQGLRAAAAAAATAARACCCPRPAQGSVTLPRDELAKRYSGVVLFVRPHFRFDQRTPLQRPTRARPLVLERAAGAALRLPRRDAGGAAGQPVRAGLPAVLDERVRPRGAQQRGRNAVGAGDRRRAGAAAPTSGCASCAATSSTRPARASTSSCRPR